MIQNSSANIPECSPGICPCDAPWTSSWAPSDGLARVETCTCWCPSPESGSWWRMSVCNHIHYIIGYFIILQLLHYTILSIKQYCYRICMAILTVKQVTRSKQNRNFYGNCLRVYTTRYWNWLTFTNLFVQVLVWRCTNTDHHRSPNGHPHAE